VPVELNFSPKNRLLLKQRYLGFGPSYFKKKIIWAIREKEIKANGTNKKGQTETEG
jgi:hypothetical protein